jgi:hypothetical protein
MVQLAVAGRLELEQPLYLGMLVQADVVARLVRRSGQLVLVRRQN